tara:strand:- start:1046 stop:1363 length:318 start_codon:yes stop_codon:yes gene_type:complete
MKVQNMRSPKSNNPVANQFSITDHENKVKYFQSYNAIIVKKCLKEDKIYLDNYYWDYSRTTTKYRNQYLGENTAETRKKIKSGEYILINLNGHLMDFKGKQLINY